MNTELSEGECAVLSDVQQGVAKFAIGYSSEPQFRQAALSIVNEWRMKTDPFTRETAQQVALR